jgi:hypothetical protein
MPAAQRSSPSSALAQPSAQLAVARPLRRLAQPAGRSSSAERGRQRRLPTRHAACPSGRPSPRPVLQRQPHGTNTSEQGLLRRSRGANRGAASTVQLLLSPLAPQWHWLLRQVLPCQPSNTGHACRPLRLEGSSSSSRTGRNTGPGPHPSSPRALQPPLGLSNPLPRSRPLPHSPSCSRRAPQGPASPPGPWPLLQQPEQPHQGPYPRYMRSSSSSSSSSIPPSGIRPPASTWASRTPAQGRSGPTLPLLRPLAPLPALQQVPAPDLSRWARGSCCGTPASSNPRR